MAVSEKLGEIRRLTEASDATLRVARVKPQVRAMLAADGVIDQIGQDHVYGNVYEAVDAELQAG
jgi:sulfate permease, SulP family